MAPLAQIFLLGGLHTRISGQTTTRFYSEKAELLLARLSLAPDRAFAREELIDWLWPDAELAAGRTSLRSILASLRRVLEVGENGAGSVLYADRQRIFLVATAIRTDVALLEKNIQAAIQTTDKRDKVDLLCQATALYRGELLPGLYNDWVMFERDRLATLYCQALQMLIPLWESDGNIAAAIETAQRWTQEKPFDERALRFLLRLLRENGQTDQARHHYAMFCRRLESEFGAEPESATQDLVSHFILPHSSPTKGNVVPVTEPSGPDLLRFATMPVSIPAGRLWGRDDELDRLEALLVSSRLVVLTGTGGVGKTRLALETLRRLVSTKEVLYLSLPEDTRVEQVPEAIVTACKLPLNPRKTAFDQLYSFLSGRSVLLAIDNSEVLVSEADTVVTQLVAHLPQLRVLLISRRKAKIVGAKIMELQPLALPPPEAGSDREHLLMSPSVAMLVDRIRSGRVSLELTPYTVKALARLCIRLDGLPLALELAAARCDVMTPAQIETALDKPFRLLVSSKIFRGRHRSLFTTISWSESLLTQDARRFFGELCIFRGSFSLEASLALDPNAAELTEELVDASLVQIEHTGGTIRFRLSDSIREFATYRRQEFDPENQSGRRALTYLLQYAEEHASRLDGPEARSAIESLQIEEDSFRAVLSFCLETADLYETGLRLCNALRKFWFLRARLSEGIRWLTQFLDRGNHDPVAIARARLDRGTLAWGLADWHSAYEDLQSALNLFQEQNDPIGQGWCFLALGQTQHGQGNYPDSIHFAEQSLARFRAETHLFGEASALHLLANNRLVLGGSEAEVRSLYDRSIVLYRRINNPFLLGAALTHLGVFYMGVNRVHAAKRLHEEAIELLRASDSRRSLAYALNSYGSILGELKQSGASAAYQESLHLFREMGERQGMASVLSYLGMVECVAAPLQAQAWLRESLLLWQEMELSYKPGVLVAFYAMAFVRYLTGDSESAAQLFGASDTHYHRLCQELNDTMVEEKQFVNWRKTAEQGILPERWIPFYENGTHLDWETTLALAVE